MSNKLFKYRFPIGCIILALLAFFILEGSDRILAVSVITICATISTVAIDN